MKKLSLTSDAPSGWCKVWDIAQELYGLEKAVFPSYAGKFDYELALCFRCLHRESGWKSKRRFYNDEQPWLGLDMVVYEEDMRPFADGRFHPRNKVEQRLIMGEELMGFLTETFKKYKTKLGGIKEYGDRFLNDVNKWLTVNFWLLDADNELKFNRIAGLTFDRTMEFLGVPDEKRFESSGQGEKIQYLVWDNILNNSIETKYILRSGVWHLENLEINITQ